jgi:alanine racemase
MAGDRVVLWGDGPTVEEVAGAARTIPWTLMTGINRRVAVRLDGATVPSTPAPAPA